MASLSFIVGIVGTVTCSLMYASPTPTFRHVVRCGSTENFKGLPYIITLLCSSLWTFYGLIKPKGLLIAIPNGIGSFFGVIFVTLFLIYAPKDIKVQSLKLVAILNVACLGLVIAITFIAFHGSLRITVVGVLGVALTISMYASPLSSMRMVVKTRSVEYMPFFLSLFQLINSSIWVAWSVLSSDHFVLVPNAVGVVLGSAQLVLYFMYKNGKPQSLKSNLAKENGLESMFNNKPLSAESHVKAEVSEPDFMSKSQAAAQGGGLDHVVKVTMGMQGRIIDVEAQVKN